MPAAALIEDLVQLPPSWGRSRAPLHRVTGLVGFKATPWAADKPVYLTVPYRLLEQRGCCPLTLGQRNPEAVRGKCFHSSILMS